MDKKYTNLENVIKKQQNKNEQLEVKIKVLEASNNLKLFKCIKCEFTSASEKGLKNSYFEEA